MNAHQDWMAGKIDRKREAPQAKAARAARATVLRLRAREHIAALMVEIETPEEQGQILRDLLDMVAERLHPITGRVEAATAFNARAADICATFRLDRAVKNAAAEHAFARMTKAANDRGGDHG